MSLVCLPVKGRNTAELKKMITRAASAADIVEVWMDELLLEVTAREIRDITKKPLLAVCKGKRERGAWRGGEEGRMQRLLECATAGFEYIDVDIRTREQLIRGLVRDLTEVRKKNRRCVPILSYHDFKKTPSLSEMKKIYAKALRMGAGMVKIAVTAETLEDNLKVLSMGAFVNGAAKVSNANGAAAARSKKRVPLIFTVMGAKGRIGRIAAPLFGSPLIYLAADKKNRTAPGQLTVDEYKKIASVIDSR